MRRRILKAALASIAAASTLAGCSSAPVAKEPSVPVPLGEPVYVQALHYTELFAEKPFDEAILIYMRNGSYKILSPGEDHSGSYVSGTEVAAGPEEVTFMSWPATDWADNVAWHTLTFDTTTGAFTQVLRLPGDPAPKEQKGYAAALEFDGVDMQVEWDALRSRFDGAFDELSQRASSGR